MPGNDLSQYLSFLLATANRQMRMGLSESIGRSAKDQDFTEEHWRILHVLSDEQGRSMGELAEIVQLNGPALTKNIDKLVGRSVVQRAADPQDSRRVLVYISDLGLDTVTHLQRGVDAHQQNIEQALGPRNTLKLKKLLETLIAESKVS